MLFLPASGGEEIWGVLAVVVVHVDQVVVGDVGMWTLLYLWLLNDPVSCGGVVVVVHVDQVVVNDVGMWILLCGLLNDPASCGYLKPYYSTYRIALCSEASIRDTSSRSILYL